MKNQINRKIKYSKYILQDSIKTINKHFSDLSISISGELTFNNSILYKRQFHKIEFEMF